MPDLSANLHKHMFLNTGSLVTSMFLMPLDFLKSALESAGTLELHGVPSKKTSSIQTRMVTSRQFRWGSYAKLAAPVA
jgi:hypothetical protein